MKSKLVFILLLVTIFLFPGCYTVLLVEPTDEVVSYSPCPIMPYNPEPLPTPPPPPRPGPCPPAPPPYFPPPVYVDNNPPSTPPSTDDRRLTHTGRGPADSNPAPARNDENNKGTRDSGVQRSGHADSSPAPAQRDQNSSGTRDTGARRH